MILASGENTEFGRRFSQFWDLKIIINIIIIVVITIINWPQDTLLFACHTGLLTATLWNY